MHGRDGAQGSGGKGASGGNALAPSLAPRASLFRKCFGRMFRTNFRLASIESQLAIQEERISTMATKADLDAAIAALQASQAAQITRVQKQIDTLNATITSLQNNQTGDVSAEVSQIQSVAAALDAEFPDTASA